MNQYLAELKKIADNFENYQHVDDLKQELFAFSVRINNDEKEAEKTSFKASDKVGSIVSKFFQSGSDTESVRTGFSSFDRAIVGFQKGELIVIGGRPGMGKTQFMIQLATNIAKQNKGVAVLSLEMSAEVITQKLLANLGQLSPSIFIRQTEYADAIEIQLSNAISQLKELPIYLYDNPSSYLNKLSNLIRKLVAENSVEVIFIDYLQLIAVGSRRLNREAEISIICRELKQLAVELGIVLIANSQLSRQVENRPGGSKRPQLSDLRESGAIEQDADKVIFLYRPEYYAIEVDENGISTKGKMELILSKNRNGPMCDFNVIAAFHKSIIVDEDYLSNDIFIRTPNINISKDRLKDFDSNTNNDLTDPF